MQVWAVETFEQSERVFRSRNICVLKSFTKITKTHERLRMVGNQTT